MLRIKEPSQTSPSIPLRWAQKPLLDFVPLGWGFDPAGLPALLTVKSILQRDLLFTSPVSWLFQLPCESGCDVPSVTPEIDKGIRSPVGSFVPFEIYSLHQAFLSTFHVLGTNAGRLLHPWMGGAGSECYSFGVPCLAEHLAWKETQKGFFLAKEWFAPLVNYASGLG